VLALPLLLLGAEGIARFRDLDRQAARLTLIDPELTARYGDHARTLGVEYVPRDFQLDDRGFTTRWGRCDWESSDRTLLVLGDSTTRMVGSVPRSTGYKDNAPELSWPGWLAAWLRPGARICVFAEDGYHPADYERALAALAPRLSPDAIALLLCPNDLTESRLRTVEETAEGIVLVEPPHHVELYPPLEHEALWERSVAFRALHRYLARRTGQVTILENPDATTTTAALLLSRMADQHPQLRTWYLPRLETPDPSRPLYPELSRSGSKPPTPITLPEPLRQWWRNPHDPEHLNWLGQEQVARRIGASFPELIEVPPEPAAKPAG